MKTTFLSVLICATFTLQAQYNYEPSEAFPYGRPHPEAPQQIKDFEPIIGKCNCKSITRKANGQWNDTLQMTWTFKYIMNGYAIQDETLKEDGGHSGSIRQFIADSSKWYVHYYSNKSPSPILPAWEGHKQGDSIVLYRAQKAPTGQEGFYRITFKNMNKKGFDWLGEWVNTTETFRYPTWKIYCTKED